MVKRYIRWLAIVSKKIKDAYTPKSYTWRMVLVPKPTAEAPFPCILMTFSNGHSKILLRFKDLQAYDDAFHLTTEERERITQGLVGAVAEADRMEEDNRLIYQKRRMAAGAKWIDTSSGEIIAEAEQIVRDIQSAE